MRLLDLRRLNFVLAIKVVAAYFFSKVLRRKVLRDQEQVLTYFRYLVKLNLYHEKSVGKYFRVNSPLYHQFYLRKPFSSDYAVFRQIFSDHEYSTLAKAIDASCNSDSIAMIDGGANIGLTTIYLTHFFRDRKKIQAILVEPFRDNVESCRLNIDAQGIENVYYENAGLHNRKCFLKVEQSYRDGLEWSTQIVDTDEKNELSSIEIMEIVNKYNLPAIDVLKLDIEGAERFLFEDEDYASTFLKKVRVVAIELHREYNIEEKVKKVLTNNGFDLQKHLHTYIGTRSPRVSADTPASIRDHDW